MASGCAHGHPISFSLELVGINSKALYYVLQYVCTISTINISISIINVSIISIFRIGLYICRIYKFNTILK